MSIRAFFDPIITNKFTREEELEDGSILRYTIKQKIKLGFDGIPKVIEENISPKIRYHYKKGGPFGWWEKIDK